MDASCVDNLVERCPSASFVFVKPPGKHTIPQSSVECKNEQLLNEVEYADIENYQGQGLLSTEPSSTFIFMCINYTIQN